jgi:hypothetical protein
MQDTCLELSWIRCWLVTEYLWEERNCPRWITSEPEICTQIWSSWWNGRFRKVTIDANLHADPDTTGDATKGMVEAAEVCARRLVGDGGEMTKEKFEEVLEDGLRTWSRRIVVERNI